MERRRLVVCVVAPTEGQGLPPSARQALQTLDAAADAVEVLRLPPLSGTRLRRLLRRHRPWVVLAETGPVGLSSAAACVREGIPMVVRFHGRDAFGQRDVAAVGAAYQGLFAAASAVVATSRGMLSQLESLGAPPGHLTWLPCGIDLTSGNASGGAGHASSSGSRPSGQGQASDSAVPDVIWAGRLDAYSGPQRALDVFSLVLREVPEARLRLVGNGPQAAALAERLAGDPSLAGAVTLVGPGDGQALPAAWSGRVFLSTFERPYNATVEATPTAAMQAAAHGLPVVGTRHGGLLDVVVEGVTGWLADERDLAGLAAAVVRVLTDPELGARAGAAGRQRVAELFARPVCEQRLLALLRSVAAGEAWPATEAALECQPPQQSPPPGRDVAAPSSLPSVSILIPAHNAEAWVGQAIESAIAQNLPQQEIIVVDDGSRDATAVVLASFGERIRWESTTHRGGNATRNRLLELASGEWLQYLDADDLLLPGKIRSQLLPAVACGADLVVSPGLDGHGDWVHAPVGDDAWEDLLVSRMGVTSANLFRRAAVEAAGGWKTTQAASQEYELMQRLLRQGAGVIAVGPPRTIKRNINPRSVWVRDRRSSISAAERNLEEALAWLQEQGRFTPRLAALTCRRFFRLCQWRWAEGGLQSAGVRDLARRIDPEGRWLVSGLLPAHRWVYQALAFPPLRWAFRPVYKLRMVTQEKLKRLRVRRSSVHTTPGTTSAMPAATPTSTLESTSAAAR